MDIKIRRDELFWGEEGIWVTCKHDWIRYLSVTPPDINIDMEWKREGGRWFLFRVATAPIDVQGTENRKVTWSLLDLSSSRYATGQPERSSDGQSALRSIHLWNPLTPNDLALTSVGLESLLQKICDKSSLKVRMYAQYTAFRIDNNLHWSGSPKLHLIKDNSEREYYPRSKFVLKHY